MQNSPTNASEMEFLIDFTLEVLYGCKWNCAGCNVDKYGQNGFGEGDFDRLLDLFKDLQANNHILSNLALGPTDFMTSDNTLEIIEQIAPMMDMFAAITLPTSFLEKPDQIEQWGKVLNPLFAGRELKFATPLNPAHYKNRKMFDTILRNRDVLVEHMPDAKYTKTYFLANLLEYRAYNKDPFNQDKITFEEYNDIFHKNSKGNYLDVVITAGRSPLKDINHSQRLKDIWKYYNDVYDNAFQTDTSKGSVNFACGKLHEGFDKDYVYRNGNIYAPIFVGEPLVIFEDQYCIPNDADWTTSTLVDFENQTLVDSFQYMPSTKQCSDCEFATLCTSRGVLKLMEILKIRDCMAPKRAMRFVRN